MLVAQPNGGLGENARTCGRIQDISHLISEYSWASNSARRVFPAGFDVGEQFALRNYKEIQEPRDPSDKSYSRFGGMIGPPRSRFEGGLHCLVKTAEVIGDGENGRRLQPAPGDRVYYCKDFR